MVERRSVRLTVNYSPYTYRNIIRNHSNFTSNWRQGRLTLLAKNPPSYLHYKLKIVHLTNEY